MRTKKSGKRQSGQGLVEYALILALVAVVVIAIIGLAGLAVQRSYGVIGAVMGAKKEEAGVITFSYYPRCGFLAGYGTGLYAEINSSIPMSDLTVSTDTGFITTLTDMGSGLYKIQPLFTTSNDTGVCPHGLIVQASQAYGGASALYPVTIQSW